MMNRKKLELIEKALAAVCCGHKELYPSGNDIESLRKRTDFIDIGGLGNDAWMAVREELGLNTPNTHKHISQEMCTTNSPVHSRNILTFWKKSK